MTMFDIITVLIVLTALFGYVNYRTIKLPTTIGVMSISLLVSLGIVAMGAFGSNSPQHQAEHIISNIDFNKALLHGMLAFLLFAGALHIKFADLTRQKGVIITLSTVGVIVSTFIVGGLTWGGLRGGISVALALSLPPWPGRHVIIVITYTIVVFSILVQGLTLGKLAQRFFPHVQRLD